MSRVSGIWAQARRRRTGARYTLLADVVKSFYPDVKSGHYLGLFFIF